MAIIIFIFYCYILLQPQNILKVENVFFFFFCFVFVLFCFIFTTHKIAIISDASK